MSPVAVGGAMLDFSRRILGLRSRRCISRDRRDAVLRRVATYGFSQESEQGALAFQDAESLVGQAAASRRVIQLQDVPDNYVKVVSGLGMSAPKHLVMSPIEKRRAGERCRLNSASCAR